MPLVLPGETDIPNKILIEEIRKRPDLYDKTLPGYAKSDLKRKLWCDIADKLFPEYWKTWGKMERTEAIFAIQKRWGNLRTCFAREMKKQIKRKESSDPNLDDKKYRYYDRMMFLYKFMSIRINDDQEDGLQQVNESNESDNQDDQDWQEEYVEQYLDDAVENDVELVDSDEDYEVPTKIIKKEKSYEDVVDPLDVILRKKNSRQNIDESKGIDQEKNFALSLVPMLKGLPLNKKIKAQIEILKVFQRITENDI